jgi:hypothetical protein
VVQRMRKTKGRIKIDDPDLEVAVSFKFTVDNLGQLGGVVNIHIVGDEQLAPLLEARAESMTPAIYQLRDAILSAIGAVKVRLPASTSSRVARA